ncbi:hypothetical protein MD588_08415 [Photobacterium sp. SDRW27]|uniref:hypothetical protein n=1 Tax=Photobacterium obscurum TaxID=2829490 RepID=UPI002243762B|nr:hypothetical protein [Photobacterium obscurum]MCW8328831.1 hypothetical protein [Photobacterium obscurum]
MIKAINLQKKLPLKYQRITSVVGCIGVFLGVVMIIQFHLPLASLLGIDPDLPMRLQDNYQLALLLLFISMALSIYVGVVCVAGTFSLVMCILRKFTIKEALLYTFLSKFPRSWSR